MCKVVVTSRAETITRRRFLSSAVGCGAAMSLVPGCVGVGEQKHESKKWKMKLATSSVMFDRLPIEQVCERVKRLGLGGLDIWAPFTYDGAQCKHLEEIKNRLGGNGLRELMGKHKLEVAAFTIYQNNLSQYWEMIRDYGGGVVVRSDNAEASSPEDMTKNMRVFFENLKPEIELAEKSNSVLAIENHGGGLFNTIDSFRAFVELNPNARRVGIAFAPWHLQAFKAPIEDVIKIAGPQIRFFYAWQRADGSGQLPGFGPADFTPWLQALADARYSHYVSIFLHGHGPADEMESNVCKSRNYLLDRYGYLVERELDKRI
jgi:sugar phosphate isomerase/epimerase